MAKWLEELLYPHGRYYENTIILVHEDLVDERTGEPGRVFATKRGTLWEVTHTTFPSGRVEPGINALAKYDLQLTSHKSEYPIIVRKRE